MFCSGGKAAGRHALLAAVYCGQKGEARAARHNLGGFKGRLDVPLLAGLAHPGG